MLILGIALIAAFARPADSICYTDRVRPTSSPQGQVAPTPAVATNGEPFPWKNIRLPHSVIPLTYDIKLHPNLTTFQFTGNVSIKIKTLDDTHFVVLHARDLNITQYEMYHAADMSRIRVVKYLYYKGHQQIYLETRERLQGGKEFIVKLSFTGILSANMAGFYKSSYTTSSGEKR